MLDRDLAELYGVETKVLNQAVSGAGFTSQEKCEVYKLLSQLICQKTEK